MWSFYFNELIGSLPLFFKGLWVTVSVSALSLVVGGLAGFLLGILRSRKNRILRTLIGAWVDVVRGTPFLVQIFIVFFILPELGIQLEAFHAAVLALANLSACFICEIVCGAIAAVPSGQKEAAIAAGLSSFQQLRYVVMPQAMKLILPPLVSQCVLLIKDSAVVSAIGLLDVTRAGWLVVQRIPEGLMVFGLVAILYFVICYPLIHLGMRLEGRSSPDAQIL